MKNILIIIGFIILLVFSSVSEPIDDAIDAFAGVTTETFDPAIDGVGGVSTLYGDDDGDENEEEPEDEDDD